MRKLIIALAATAAIAGCTTTEKDIAVGTAVGAGAGALVGGTEGALVGAAVGATTGVVVRNLRNGFCEYRDKNGRIYTARC
jgi:hypothetical protein